MNNIPHSTQGAVFQTPCAHCPLRAMQTFRGFAPEELDFVRRLKIAELHAVAGSTVLLEGDTVTHLYTVLAGWGFRYKTLSDGRRQILNFVLPGDFIGLQSSCMAEMRHSVEALSDVTLCVFPRERLWELYRDHPHLAMDLTWLAARQEVLLDDNLLSLGRRTARERLAYLILHLYLRAKELGLAVGDEVALPLTQQHLADALGLSLVHTNKTLKRLTRSELVHWRGGRLRILDFDALVALARYEIGEQPPRPFI